MANVLFALTMTALLLVIAAGKGPHYAASVLALGVLIGMAALGAKLSISILAEHKRRSRIARRAAEDYWTRPY